MSRDGVQFPEDDAGREDLEILCTFHALHPTHGLDQVNNCLELMAPWCAGEAKDRFISDLFNRPRLGHAKTS